MWSGPGSNSSIVHLAQAPRPAARRSLGPTGTTMRAPRPACAATKKTRADKVWQGPKDHRPRRSPVSAPHLRAARSREARFSDERDLRRSLALDLGAQAILLSAELGRVLLAEVLGLEYRADLDFRGLAGHRVGATSHPLDGFFDRLDLPDPKA